MSDGKTITVHLDDLTLRRLEYVRRWLLPWRSIEDLAESAVSETALDYAKKNGGPME